MADHPVQPATLNTLHGVVAKRPSLPDIEDRNDMRMVQPRGRASLVQEPAPRRRVGGGVNAQNLEGHRPVQPHVNRLIDGPHAPSSQLADHSVTCDPPSRFEAPPRPPAWPRASLGARRPADQSVH